MSAISNILKSAYLLGILMLAVQALLNHFLSSWNGFGFFAGLLIGAAYAALHKQGMSEGDKFRTLFVFLAVAALSSFLVGTRHIGEYTTEFAMLVSGFLVGAYAVCGYIGLTLGSFTYARLAKFEPRKRALRDLPKGSWKNSYLLGAGILVGEILFNLAYSALAGEVRTASGMSMVLAMVAGTIYASWHREKMPARERLKALSVYVPLVALFVVGLSGQTGRYDPIFLLLVGGAFILLYAVIMYFFMGWGSSFQMKAIEKRAAKDAARTPQA